MIRILEAIVFRRIHHKRIYKCQYFDQAGFTKEKSTETLIMQLWDLIERSNNDDEQVCIGSLDIKGAYDGIKHETILDKLRIWKREGYMNATTVEQIKFLFSQYKLGLVENKN